MLFLDYTPAELKMCKSRWYISFYVKNPQTEKLQRKTIKVNRVKNLTARKRYARQMVLELNKKLESGWNPFIEQEAGKSYHLLFDAFDTFLRIKEKELRADSFRTYKSQVKILKAFIHKIYGNKNVYAITFTRQNALDYLNYIYSEKNVSARVYNNYKVFCLTLWNWLVEQNYCKANVFKQISPKIVRDKTRIFIDKNTRKRIKEYLEKKGEKEFLAVIFLTFYGLLRPKESLNLKPCDIDLENRIITIPPEIAKTGKMRKVTITDTLYNQLLKLDIQNIHKDNYIFSRDYKPGKIILNTRDTGRTWANLRKELNLPKEMQFYSLKDTGIVQLLQDGVSPEMVRDQAGHSSLEMTNKYIQISNNEANTQILNKSSDF